MLNVKNLAGNIKKLRVSRNETQEQFAEGCDISVETQSLIERSEVIPKVETILKIMEYTECSFDDLMDNNTVKRKDEK